MIDNSQTFFEGAWEVLLNAIKNGRCTPVIGAGISQGVLPLGRNIAKRWAEEYAYPFQDSDNLARVAQFISVRDYPAKPYELLAEDLQRISGPNFDDPQEPYRVLAALPLPLYITTNYDNFLEQALKQGYKDPKAVIARWKRMLSPPEGNDHSPTVDEPMVFHLHGGIWQPESLVLSENDYWDLIISAARDATMLPAVVRAACSTNLLLFLGYRLDDWNFRVLFRVLAEYMEKSLRKQHVIVMLQPSNSNELSERVRKFYERQFRNSGMRVYWGTIREFVAQLRERMESA